MNRAFGIDFANLGVPQLPKIEETLFRARRCTPCGLDPGGRPHGAGRSPDASLKFFRQCSQKHWPLPCHRLLKTPSTPYICTSSFVTSVMNSKFMGPRAQVTHRSGFAQWRRFLP